MNLQEEEEEGGGGCGVVRFLGFVPVMEREREQQGDMCVCVCVLPNMARGHEHPNMSMRV